MGEWQGTNHIFGGLGNSFGVEDILAWAQDVICILSLHNPQHAKLPLLKNSDGSIGHNTHSAKQIVWPLWASWEH